MSVYMNVVHAMQILQEENKKLKELLLHYLNLKLSFINYVEETNLVSETYQNHKMYFTLAQIPTLNGIMELCKRMVEANDRYFECVTVMLRDGIINQELWEETLINLRLQYNYLYINKENLEKKSGEGLFYISNTPYGREYRRNPYVIKDVKDEINVLYTMIIKYKEKLLRLDNMLNEINSIYYDCENLYNGVIAAIDQLKLVQINEDGIYALDSMDASVFTNLNNNLVALQIKDAIVEQLGKEAMSAFVNNLLSEDEKKSMIVQMVDIAADFAPSISNTMGYIEIPIWPGVSVYYKNTVTANIGEDIPVGWVMSMKDSGEYLSTVSISYDDIMLKGNKTSFGVRYKERIDEYSYVYAELVYHLKHINCEYGITQAISGERTDIKYSQSITNAVGINATPMFTTWQPETISNVAYSEVAEPEWDVEVVIYEIPHVEVEVNLVEGFLNNMLGGIVQDEYLELGAKYGGLVFKFGGCIASKGIFKGIISIFSLFKFAS